MNRVWSDSQQSGSALLLLLAIADHANDDGVCWPSVARLAQRARVKERQAQNIIKELAASGEIDIQHGAGRSHTSLYIIRLGVPDGEKVQSTAPIKGKEKGAIQRQKVQSSTKKVQSSTVKGAADCTRSIIEPPIEPPLESSSPPMAGDDDGNAAKGLIAELQARQFVYLDKHPQRLADNLLSEFGWDRCLAALETTAAKHLEQIHNSGRGIAAPLAYMRSVLVNGNGRGYTPAKSKAQQSMDAVDEYRAIAQKHGATHV